MSVGQSQSLLGGRGLWGWRAGGQLRGGNSKTEHGP
jgi:hypothetical protein